MKLSKNRILNCSILFCICLLVHTAEVLFIRTDETVFAECFINKVFGILLLFFVLHFLGKKWRDIGFVREKFLRDCLKGFALCAVFYTVGFLAEFLLLKSQGSVAHLEFFVSGFSLTGNVVKQTGVPFLLLCIFFNIINVWMEEGLFRGFFVTYLRGAVCKKSFPLFCRTALWTLAPCHSISQSFGRRNDLVRCCFDFYEMQKKEQ